MSQSSVHRFLKENKGWFSAKEIADKLGQGVGSTSSNLRRLKLSGFILFKSVKTLKNRRLYYKSKEV